MRKDLSNFSAYSYHPNVPTSGCVVVAIRSFETDGTVTATGDRDDFDQELVCTESDYCGLTRLNLVKIALVDVEPNLLTGNTTALVLDNAHREGVLPGNFVLGEKVRRSGLVERQLNQNLYGLLFRPRDTPRSP